VNGQRSVNGAGDPVFMSILGHVFNSDVGALGSTVHTEWACRRGGSIRFSVGHIKVNGDVRKNRRFNGGYYDEPSEFVTVAVPSGVAFVDATNLIPAGAIVRACAARVQAQPGGTSSMQIGVPGGGGGTARYASGVSTVAGTRDDGDDDGARPYGADTSIRLTFDATTTDAAGSVRLQLFYDDPSAPTS